MTRDDIRQAAELLDRLVAQATPGPWRDTSVDGNRFGALVSDTCTRGCDEWAARVVSDQGLADWERDLLRGHPHDGYDGCLVGESHTPSDRRLMAVQRNVADLLPRLLHAVADEDPVEVGRVTRAFAAVVLGTHRPVSEEEPP